MSREDQNEAIPYLSPATAPSQDEVANNDEDDYRTLNEIKKILDKAIADLPKDFNAFDLSKDAKINLEAQVAGRQVAYDILVPIQGMVDSAINAVEDSRKAQYGSKR